MILILGFHVGVAKDVMLGRPQFVVEAVVLEQIASRVCRPAAQDAADDVFQEEGFADLGWADQHQDLTRTMLPWVGDRVQGLLEAFHKATGISHFSPFNREALINAAKKQIPIS